MHSWRRGEPVRPVPPDRASDCHVPCLRRPSDGVMENYPKMDLSPYDPAEVSRYHANQDDDGALMRFAMHVRKVNPGHIWPSLIFSHFGGCPEEAYYYIEEAVRLGCADLEAEQAGQPVKAWTENDKKLFRGALYKHIHQAATLGFADSARHSLAKAVEFDPTDQLDTTGMATRLGVIPMEAAETAYRNRM